MSAYYDNRPLDPNKFAFVEEDPEEEMTRLLEDR